MGKPKKSEKLIKERREKIRSTGSKEQRNFIRTGVSIPVVMHILGKKSEKKINAHAWNISASGMMIECPVNMAVGINTAIDMAPPQSLNPIHCRGKVVWVFKSPKKNMYNYGIELTAIEEDNKNTFLKFLCDIIYHLSKTV